MLLTVLEAPVAFMYALTGNKKLGKVVRRMNRKRKEILDKFLDENPELDVDNYQQVERKKMVYFWAGIAIVFLVFILVPAIAGYGEIH